MKIRIAACAFIMAVASFISAEPAVQGFYLDQNLGGAYNPLGVQLGTKFLYRMPLDIGKGVLWESAKIDAGLGNELSPAYDFIGAFVDAEPIAIFDLAVSAKFAGYYSGLGYGFHDLAGYSAAFDTNTLDSLSSKNAIGYIVSVAPTLKFAFGPFAFSNTFHVNYFNVDGGGGYFYEAYANCVLAKSDIDLFNDAYALLSIGSGIMVGLNDSFLIVPASGYQSQVLQAIGILQKSLSGRLSVYAALMAGLYLEDRYYQYSPHVAGQVGFTSAL
ncbi:MAG: hypothetical protein ABSF43_03445 [Rectinemataceae bacterium]|jgi:hypothetical protein